ncbi:MAG TPA: hypothetical protein VI911_12060 [Patescibacteria group bacterium]|nr:hypothetical protein [Patescibacteria group bacterium]
MKDEKWTKIELLEGQARSYMLIAKAMQNKGCFDIAVTYINQGIECCNLAISMKEKENERTSTFQYDLVA